MVASSLRPAASSATGERLTQSPLGAALMNKQGISLHSSCRALACPPSWRPRQALVSAPCQHSCGGRVLTQRPTQRQLSGLPPTLRAGSRHSLTLRRARRLPVTWQSTGGGGRSTRVNCPLGMSGIHSQGHRVRCFIQTLWKAMCGTRRLLQLPCSAPCTVIPEVLQADGRRQLLRAVLMKPCQ